LSFYGVLIYMYFLDNKQHHTPHIHAEYAGQEAVFDIDSGELIDGSIPKKQTRLVQAWIELRKEELRADWRLASQGSPIERIEPLR
jgi:Domain of unknown function (DUF4160)